MIFFKKWCPKFVLFVNAILIIGIFGQDTVPNDVEVLDAPSREPPAKVNVVHKLLPYQDFGIFEFSNNYNNYGDGPLWKVLANLVTEGADQTIAGTVTFRQASPRQPVLVAMNITGLPSGKHAVHIHAFGDLSMGCQSTGPNFQNNMIGNVETKEDGSAAFQFLSPFIQLFGIQGIVGRSIVIHEKPSQYPQIYTPVINPPTYPYQAEEDVVGGRLACGIITVTSNT